MRFILQKIFLLIALTMVPSSCVYAQNSNMSMIGNEFDFNEVSEQESSSQINTERLALINNNLQYVLITAVLYAFSLVIITVLMKITPDHQAKDIVTVIGLVSVIFASILLVLVVDTTDALTAPMGILGAIAGYLFGSAQRKESSKKE